MRNTAQIMIGSRWATLTIMFFLLFTADFVHSQDEGEFAFAVITKISKDKRQVTAHVSSGGTVREMALIPTDSILDNPIWRKLEICHSLRLLGSMTSEGYRITSLRNLDAGMLPMALQGIAGDCLTKKAIEFAPAID